jgi:flagellar biosynthesis/type III secretory pathway M-ring protein FliF/YscJ
MKTGQDALGKRIDDINQRFDDINQRFDDMNQRISNQQMTTLALFSAMIALILALFAYIAWDRRTMIKPVVEHLENKLFRELEMNHDKGSTINRLINALRELAKQDEKVATVLRHFSLL